MNVFNPFIDTLNPYHVASHKIWEVGPDERQHILKLDWNEATIPPSPKVKEALLLSLQNETTFSLYPNTHNQELLKQIAKYAHVAPEALQYFASSDASHEYLCKLVLSPQSKVLLLAPTYDNFRLTCESFGAYITFCDFNTDFTLPETLLRETIAQHNPSLIYICNPNNPTGTLLTPEYIASLLSEFPQNTFLIDEAYYEFSQVSVSHLIAQFPNLFVSRTFSKAFALAGFRAGYLISQPQNIEKLNRIRNAKNFMSLTQIAVSAALKDIPYMHAYVHQVNHTKEWFSNALKDLHVTVYPSFGNYLLVRFSNETERDAVFQKLAQHDIFVRSLSHHPSVRTCLRITIGTRTQMERVLYVLTS